MPAFVCATTFVVGVPLCVPLPPGFWRTKHEQCPLWLSHLFSLCLSLCVLSLCSLYFASPSLTLSLTLSLTYFATDLSHFSVSNCSLSDHPNLEHRC